MAKARPPKPRFDFATYEDAVAASNAAIKALDLATVGHTTIACGYDGAELKIPDTMLAMLADTSTTRSSDTDLAFLHRHTWTSRVTHHATTQLKPLIKQPDWVTFATVGSPVLFQTYTRDGTRLCNDGRELQRAKCIRGGLDWLVTWLGEAAKVPQEGPEDLEASATAVLTAARDMYLAAGSSASDRMDAVRDGLKAFDMSREALARLTSVGVATVKQAGVRIKSGPLHDFYTGVFVPLAAQGATRGGFGVGITHTEPVHRWFWAFLKEGQALGWFGVTSMLGGGGGGVRARGEFKDAGRAALSDFKAAAYALRDALSVDDDSAVSFGETLRFLYDNADDIAEYGVGVTEVRTLALKLKKRTSNIIEDREFPVAHATARAVRALMRFGCDLRAGGDAQRDEYERMRWKGYPHILARTHDKGVQIHESYGSLQAFGLKTVKNDRIDIDPALICDAAGALLPYPEAVAALEAHYNEFGEGTEELDAAVQTLALVSEDAALSFKAIITRVFGVAGAQRFGDAENVVAKDSSFTQLKPTGGTNERLPVTLEFSIGAVAYQGVFLETYASELDALLEGKAALERVAAYSIYNNYGDFGKHSWLTYRGILTRADEIKVKEMDPAKDLRPAMYQDFVDFCHEVTNIDGWAHELCRYDGIGQIEVVHLPDVQGMFQYHVWGIWRT